MIALSTAWNPKKRIAKTFAAGRRMGFGAFELNGPSGRLDLPALLTDIEKHDVRISSVHAVCTEEDIPWSSTWGDWVGDADEDRRREGVRLVRETLDAARRVGAKAVVLHGGVLPMPDGLSLQRELQRLAASNPGPLRDPPGLGKFIEDRKSAAPPYLRALEASLKELCEYAPDVAIALENRYYISDLPHGDEFQVLFDRVGAPNLRAWHDVGHAYVLGRIGFLDHLGLLEQSRDRLAGVHLHDIRGFEDHRPPGTGDFNFACLGEYLRPDVIRVMEIASGFNAKEVKRGRLHLAEMYGIE